MIWFAADLSETQSPLECGYLETIHQYSDSLVVGKHIKVSDEVWAVSIGSVAIQHDVDMKHDGTVHRRGVQLKPLRKFGF